MGTRARARGARGIGRHVHRRHGLKPIEHVEVLIVGAGLSGVCAAYRIGCQGGRRSYAILEARDAIGGTWDLFRYPGVRSDSDMATLGFPFRPWREDLSLVDGPAIRRYVEETARVYGIDRHIHFGHRAVAASWSSVAARWTLEVRVGAATRWLTCDFLLMCSGYYDYDAGHAPTWPGMADFHGVLVHPQFWPDALDVRGKRVIVIGSGATAVTLVPALAVDAAQVTMLQRSPTYVVARPARDLLAGRLRRCLPPWLADALVRWKNVAYGIFTFGFARRYPARMRALIHAGVRHHLGPEFDVDRHFKPRYAPWDQRLCLVPDGDLFESLRTGRAAMVTDRIERFTATGIRLESGAELTADIIVTATGLSIKLLGGLRVMVDGAAMSLPGRLVYKGAMFEGIPNLAFAFGYTNASWTLKADLTARFVKRLLDYMTRRQFASATPSPLEPAMERQPLLDFSSGYVQRAMAALPRQGAKAPWRVRQNYFLDLLSFKTGCIADGTLRFARRPAAERHAPLAS